MYRIPRRTWRRYERQRKAAEAAHEHKLRQEQESLRRLESQRDPAIRVASGVTNGWRIDYLPDPPPRRADAPVTLDALHVPVGGVGLDEAVNRCRELRD